MIKKKLGVNIDHVATIRNARGETYPDPAKAAVLAENCGANSITIHLREDRRHIKDFDLINIKKKIKIPLNLEMSPTEKMLKIALRHKPKFVCIVPEKRKELTTEGGLDLNKNKKLLIKIVKKLNKKNIRTSFFIEPKISDVNLSKIIGASCVELHTGKFSNLYNNKKKTKIAFTKLYQAAKHAYNSNLEVHAGHGLTYQSVYIVSKIKYISEFNIGHFIISDSIFLGLKKVINKFKKIINR